MGAIDELLFDAATGDVAVPKESMMRALATMVNGASVALLGMRWADDTIQVMPVTLYLADKAARAEVERALTNVFSAFDIADGGGLEEDPESRAR